MTTPDSSPGSPSDPELSSGGIVNREREGLAEFLRFLASSVWIPWVMIRRPDAVWLWGPMLAFPVLSGAAIVAIRWNLIPKHRNLLISLLGVGLLMYVTWGLGSATTPVLVFLIMHVIGVAMTSSRGVSLTVTAAVVLCYGAILLLEARGVIPRAPLASPTLGPHETSGGRPFAFIAVSLSVASACAFLLYARRKLEQSAERERALRLAQVQAQEKAAVLQRQIELLQRMDTLGRATGTLAHDFNNLLTIIRSALVYAIEEEEPDPAELRQALDDGLSAARSAAQLTSQLLAFSRRQPVQPQSIRPAEFIQSMQTMLERVLGNGTAVSVQLDPGIGAVKIDPTQFQQVILNLAVNARDAMNGEGKLTIEGKQVVLDAAACEGRPGLNPGCYVRLTLADTGAGMDESTAQRAIEPFFTTKPRGKGTGLGLSTAFGIMQKSGGWLELRSEVGGGTAVTLLLPCEEGTERA
ncbi:MAG: hypothetical protein HY898_24185 [Deltaproteobacteria bacterium]|nr:hypothetical protein [Deltaproteobacteria bacterium]